MRKQTNIYKYGGKRERERERERKGKEKGKKREKRERRREKAEAGLDSGNRFQFLTNLLIHL